MKCTHKQNAHLIFGAAVLLFAAAYGLNVLMHFGTDSSIQVAQASAVLPADLNSDGTVNVFDLSMLLSKWNTTDAQSDLSKDGTVNIFDLSMLLTKWGAVASSTRPDATNTGVPAGVTLRSVTVAYPDAATQGYTVNAQGRVTITKDGGIYDAVHFPAGVVIKAKNVIIRNSLMSGGRSSFTNMLAEPTSWDHCRSIVNSGASVGSSQIVDANASSVVHFLIEDSEIAVDPDDYSVYVNNYMGHDTTMRRVNMHGGVDGIGTYNSSATTANFTIEDSYVHDLYKGKWSPGNYNLDPSTGTKVYCGYDAAHPEGNHSDGIQMHGGTGINIHRNSFFVNAVSEPQTNAGLMMNKGGDIHVTNNHFKWGVCSVNMPAGLTGVVEVLDNTFYGNNGSTGTAGQDNNGCSIIRSSTAGYIFSNNLWEIGTPIRLING